MMPLGLLATLVSALAAADQPNIVFIFSDDHASHAISAYDDRLIDTPHLDRLANEGMKFENCFCTNSLCGPSRAVILTGKHSHLNGFRMNGDTFDGSQQTFPKLLQSVGYQTAIVGKWHLRTEPTGFDHYEVLIGQGTYYNSPFRTPGGTEKTEGYTTTLITDRALSWLKEKRDPKKPFMLMYQHKAPHREWQPGPGYFDLYDDRELPEPDTLFDDYEGRGRAAHEQDMEIATTLTARDLKLTPPPYLNDEQLQMWHAAYDAKNAEFREANLSGRDLVRWKYQRYMKDYLRCVKAMDDQIGRVLDYLDEAGLSENTLVVYSSDQGFYLGEHGWFDKRFMYEESYRQPLLARWPGHIEAGSVNTDLVSNLDFAQTLLDVAGVQPPSDMQGLSLKPLLEGQQPDTWRDALYYHYYEFRNDRRTAHMVRRHCGVRTDRYKLMHFYNLGEWELYDLQTDPNELKSVYGSPDYSEIEARLTQRLTELQEQYRVPDDTGSVDPNPPSLKLPANGRRKKPAQPKKKAA